MKHTYHPLLAPPTEPTSLCQSLTRFLSSPSLAPPTQPHFPLSVCHSPALFPLTCTTNRTLSQSLTRLLSSSSLAPLTKPHFPLLAMQAEVSVFRAPEVADLSLVSQKADVYSFGVVLFQILTGKNLADILQNKGLDIVKWVKSVSKSNWTSNVLDGAWLLTYGTEDEKSQRQLQLAINCLNENLDARPNMAAVASGIEDIKWPLD